MSNSSDSGGVIFVYGAIFLSIAAYGGGNIFESNKFTEYTEGERCVLISSVAKDTKTGNPIKRDADGKWQWYTPDKSEYTCFQDNLNKIIYRTYGESSKVVALVDEGELQGSVYELKDCVVADAKNWACAMPQRTMKDGVSNSDHIGHWKWTLNWITQVILRR